MLEQNVPGEFRALADVQQRAEERLLAMPNVNGVALGTKVSDGEDTGEQALTVLVESKLPPELLPEDARVPAEIDGVRTDVQEVGVLMAGPAGLVPAPADVAPPSLADLDGDDLAGLPLGEGDHAEEVGAQALRYRMRPARGGVSVGHYRITAGTLGTCCYDLSPFPGKPPRYYVLSNNHVLANSNAARIGDPILQPGRADGGRFPQDVIARLSRFVPIRFETPGSSPANLVDAAVAEGSFGQLDRLIHWIGTVKGMYTAPTVGDVVQKTGRTTSLTTGRVTNVNATVRVNFGGGRVARFVRQIVTTDMSAGGDSGSVVTDLDERGVGLLFAGSNTVTIMNHLHFVQALLRVRISEK